jgi:sugar phosphate isomerase/epimerase
VHERLCVSAVSSWSWSFEEDIAFWVGAGIDHVELSLRKAVASGGVEHVAKEVASRGLRVASIIEAGHFQLGDPATWPAQRDHLRQAVALAAATGAGCVVVLPGAAGVLTWEAAADALGDAIGAVANEASSRAVTLALENTSALRADLSFVHTLRDAIDLSRMIGCGVCMEVQSCWAERNLGATITAGVDQLALVQVSDYVIGSLSTPDRAVPGDGDIPLARIVTHLLAAGYDGAFDLEMVGPRIEAEGYRTAIVRGVAYLDQLLASAAR